MPGSPEESYIRRHIRGLLVQMQLLYGSQCMQSGEGGPEDCLFLNIWTTYFPAHAGSKQSKSVRFWIRGGAFTGGTANDPTIDGGNIASRGEVVMCAINCRLSTLGFLALNVGVTKGTPHSDNQQELHLSEQCQHRPNQLVNSLEQFLEAISAAEDIGRPTLHASALQM
jgi:hypothetical protein